MKLKYIVVVKTKLSKLNYSFQKTIVPLGYKTILYCKKTIVILKLTIVFFRNYSILPKTIVFHKKL
jgi:hypothetical protein